MLIFAIYASDIDDEAQERSMSPVRVVLQKLRDKIERLGQVPDYVPQPMPEFPFEALRCHRPKVDVAVGPDVEDDLDEPEPVPAAADGGRSVEHFRNVVDRVGTNAVDFVCAEFGINKSANVHFERIVRESFSDVFARDLRSAEIMTRAMGARLQDKSGFLAAMQKLTSRVDVGSVNLSELVLGINGGREERYNLDIRFVIVELLAYFRMIDRSQYMRYMRYHKLNQKYIRAHPLFPESSYSSASPQRSVRSGSAESDFATPPRQRVGAGVLQHYAVVRQPVSDELRLERVVVEITEADIEGLLTDEARRQLGEQGHLDVSEGSPLKALIEERLTTPQRRAPPPALGAASSSGRKLPRKK